MQWFQLKMSCPVKNCPRNQTMIEWCCAVDGGLMYICEEGRLCCQDNTHNSEIVCWKFDCGDRTGPHKFEHFQSPDYQQFAYAMSMAIPHLPVAGADWVCTLMKNVERQFQRND